MKGVAKKLFCVIAAAVVALGCFCSCALKESQTKNDYPLTMEGEDKGTYGYRVAYFVPERMSELFKGYEDYFEAEVIEAKNEGIVERYIIYSANGSAQTQREQMERAIEENYDIWIIYPCESGAITGVVDRALDAGIVCINISAEEKLSGAVSMYYDSYLTDRAVVTYTARVLESRGRVAIVDPLDTDGGNRFKNYLGAFEGYTGIETVLVSAEDEEDIKREFTKLYDEESESFTVDAILFAGMTKDELRIIERVSGGILPKFVGASEHIELLQYLNKLNLQDKTVSFAMTGTVLDLPALAIEAAIRMADGGVLKEAYRDEIVFAPAFIATDENIGEYFMLLELEAEEMIRTNVLQDEINDLFEEKQ